MAKKKLEIDGMVCVVGEPPVSGITVGELIGRLSEMDPALPVGFCTGPDSNLKLLSLYRARPDHGPLAVWFDLEQPE